MLLSLLSWIENLTLCSCSSSRHALAAMSISADGTEREPTKASNSSQPPCSVGVPGMKLPSLDSEEWMTVALPPPSKSRVQRHI
jgi:hypothetical protein